MQSLRGGNKMTRSYNKSFFSEKRANEFAKTIKKNSGKDVRITSARDAFNQTQYRVEWN